MPGTVPVPEPSTGTTTVPATEPTTLFDRVGGHRTFHHLVQRLCHHLADDPLLRPLFPPDRLPAFTAHLTAFLDQFWGGPRDYSRERGHPRLPLRHAHLRIDRATADAWLAAMGRALDETAMPSDARAELRGYFAGTAQAIVTAGR